MGTAETTQGPMMNVCAVCCAAFKNERIELLQIYLVVKSCVGVKKKTLCKHSLLNNYNKFYESIYVFVAVIVNFLENVHSPKALQFLESSFKLCFLVW